MSNKHYLVLDETCPMWEADEELLLDFMRATLNSLIRLLNYNHRKFMTLHDIFNRIDIALPRTLEKIQYIYGVTNEDALIAMRESVTPLYGGIDRKFKGVQITVDLDDCKPIIGTCPCCGNKIYY